MQKMKLPGLFAGMGLSKQCVVLLMYNNIKI